jgi:hypothetical protein
MSMPQSLLSVQSDCAPRDRLAGAVWKCHWLATVTRGLGFCTILLCASAAAQDRLPASRIDESTQRVEQAEASLFELQEQNRWLHQRLAETRPISFNEYLGEQPPSQSATPPQTNDEPSPEPEQEPEPEPEPEEEKRWFEKLSLRGYAQFRYNYPTHLAEDSAPPHHAGDSSIAPDQEFLIRRARVILYGDVSEHLYVYFQPDFASTPNGSVDAIYFAQIRDWYGDVYLDCDKVHRLRIGQSKVPFGWKNLQSSQNRLPLDRDDAFNSAGRNERDLGVFYYWTPEWAQDTFEFIADEGLKGSGNYGVFGFGAYNGQGGSIREFNDELHLVTRLALPLTFESGQIVEFGIQGYTGRYVVLGTEISPLGVGPEIVPLGTRDSPDGEDGLLDQRLGWTFVYYPQPIGFQAEYLVGRGPELNEAQTAVERESLHGGYAMLNYRYKTRCHGEIWPFVRWHCYEGGYKTFANSPAADIDEWNIGLEWQIREEMELVCEYLITDRTNLVAQSDRSYEQFEGEVLRFQFQINF